jgi:RHS repeat-associated protein
MAEGGSIDVRVCFTYPSSTRCATSRVQVVAHAFGGSFATAPAGPGEVALSTGEWQLGATDAALPGDNSEISVGRVWLSMAGTTGSGFGPGWQAALPADAAVGASDATVVDRTNTDGSLLLVYPDGSADIFLCTATTTTCNGTNSYAPAGETALTGARLALNAAGTALTYTDADLVATTWARSATASTTWTVAGVSDPGIQGGAAQPPAGAFATLTVDGLVVSGDRYRAVVAPTPVGVSTCTWVPTSVTFGLSRGCAALTVVTAKDTTTKPASGAVGDYPDRIKAVIATLWDPATSAVTSTVVARYGYDSAGMLVSAWDPRDTLSAGPLATGYAYSSGRLTSFTPASANSGGLTPWTFGYDALGRLVSVSRAGAGTTAVVYDGIGLSGTDLPDLTPTATATWAQDVAPTRAVAVFAPGASTSDPRQGAISYLDTTGRALNTATYGAGGWNVTTTAYTPSGQVAWELTAGNRARALTPGAGDPVGLPVGDTAARARLLRTDHVYSSADPTLEVDTFGPLADVTRPDGTITSARAHTHTAYDQGAPSSLTDADGKSRPGPWRLPTEVVSSSAVVDAAGTGSWPGGGTYTDLGKQTTSTSYANTGGPADVGWLFATPTQVTITGVGGQDLITRTVLDARGRVVQTRQPGSTGSDAGTTNTVYYTGDASAAGTACDDRPEWAGLVCQVGPAAQPASGSGVPSTMSGYTRELQVNAQVETSGGITRSTTIVRDGGGREVTRTVQVTGAPAADKQVPETTTTYWPETGLVKSVTTTAGTATTSYDTLGRVTSQTDGAGNTATTSYDTAGRVATSNDGKATTSYTYNGTDAAGKAEYRGLVTATTVSGLVGTSSGFTAAYDPDAALTLEQHPNGMRATTTLDPAGRETALVWTASAGGLLAASARQCGVDGNVAVDSSLGRVSRYRYDPADRLTRASSELSGAGTCTTRAYTFDADSNRTGLDTWTGTLGACPDTSTAPTTSAPRSYDPAGRATLSGYTYDGLGRTRTLPAVESPTGGEVTLAYYGNDLVASMTSGSTVREYGLDALGRIASWTDTVDGNTGARVVNHYADTSDRPAWTDLGNGTWTRSVTSISGDLAATITGNSTGPTATTAQLTDLHGDVVATVDNAPGAATLASATAYHEYGATADGSAQDRYGWLGAKLRPTETFTGLILMGVRIYNTITGRFLQVDPIPGGSAGPYLYPTNPVTLLDLDGKSWVRKAGRWVRNAARSAGQWAWNNRGTIASGLALAACFSPGILLCAGASAFAVGVNYHQRRKTSNRMSRREIAFNVVTIGWGTKIGYLGRLGGIARASRTGRYSFQAAQNAGGVACYASRRC